MNTSFLQKSVLLFLLFVRFSAGSSAAEPTTVTDRNGAWRISLPADCIRFPAPLDKPGKGMPAKLSAKLRHNLPKSSQTCSLLRPHA